VSGEVQQRLVFVLAVHVYKQRANLGKQAPCHDGPVYEAPALALGADDAPDEDFIARIHFHRFKRFLDIVAQGDVKDRLDVGVGGALAYECARRSLAQQQAHGIDDNRFSCAGLAG